MKTWLEVRNVEFSYRAGAPVFQGLQLEIPGGLTLLLGANGSGKSTLLKLLAGVERPDRGRVLVSGRDLWVEEVATRRELAYLPERPDLTPYASIREILALVCRLRRVDPARVDEVLAEVDLAGLGRRSIRELSKGQRRRALLAAARIGSPRVLLLDEPLDAMDLRIREQILVWTRDVAAVGSVVVVTHELEPFAPLALQAIGMTDGRARLFDELPEELDARLSLLTLLAQSRSTSPEA